LKLLVFEFINGGGFAGQPLPVPLAAEGAAMLQALLNELKCLPELELILPLDRRCAAIDYPADCEIVWVESTACMSTLLTDLVKRCDAVWPIAPETGGTLAEIAKIAEQVGKTLLLSDVQTIAICSDKLSTCRVLLDAGIAAVETLALTDMSTRMPFSRCVLKPRDGVGCEGSYVVDDIQGYAAALKRVGKVEQYVVQPYLDGDAVSLSCLFRRGAAWLLSCNQQQIRLENGAFTLDGCLVNAENSYLAFYRDLIGAVAKAMPGLWGYVGIDVIEMPDRGPIILEINPRLTTSYVGVKPATGINVAEQVLTLLDGEPKFNARQNQSFLVVLH